MGWKPLSHYNWQNTQVHTPNKQQMRWRSLCESSRYLKWMLGYVNPHNQDKLPPLPWTNEQIISFVATLMHEGKANSLRAALMTLLYHDIREMIDDTKE